MNRKAQFFIITAVLVAGSLSITVNVLDDYSQISFDALTTSPGAQQFSTFVENVDSIWYDEVWSYRSQIRVREISGRDVDSYPVAVELDTGELIDAGKMEPDCRDLRIVDGTEELPYQIAGGRDECATDNTTIWFLASVGANQNEGDFYALYGNDNVAAPEYDTGLAFDPQADRLENDLVSFRAGVEDGQYGFVSAQRSGADATNIAGDGLVLYRTGTDGQNDLSVVEQGPVYTTVAFDDGTEFTLFAQNVFLRQEGPVTLLSGDEQWYGEDDSVLGQWQAGDAGTTTAVSGSFSGSFGNDQYPYIAATNGTSQESLALFARNASIDQYNASSDGGGQSMGVSDADGPVTVDAIDWWLGESGVPDFVADRMLNPPRVFHTEDERIGEYFPSTGWSQKVTLTIEERSGRQLLDYPVNVSLNTGELGVQDDCSDIVVREADQRRPYHVWGNCDSVAFDMPDSFTLRLPVDESFGDFVNGTEPRFVGQIIDPDATAEWLLGVHDFALSLADADYIHFGRSPRVTLRGSSFVVSTWINVDQGQDFTEEVSILRYPGDSPSLNLVERNQKTVLQARLMNDTEPGTLTTVEGTTNLTEGRWHHVAFRYDDRDGNVTLFVDGQLDGQGEFTGPLDFVQDRNFTIGEGMAGDIDEFKIYKEYLTDDTIQDQQQQFTEVTLLTNLSAGRTERDIDIFAGSATSMASSYGPGDVNPYKFGTASPEPRVVASQPRSYGETVTTLQRHINDVAGLSQRFDISIQDQCTLVQYQSGSIEVSKTVC